MVSYGIALADILKKLSMQNNEQNSAQVDEESRRLKHDAESGNDGFSNDMLQKEGLIDPGNEHHHTDDDGTDSNIHDRTLKHDADAGGDATGTTGPEPGEGENDEPDSSGEAG